MPRAMSSRWVAGRYNQDAPIKNRLLRVLAKQPRNLRNIMRSHSQMHRQGKDLRTRLVSIGASTVAVRVHPILSVIAIMNTRENLVFV